MCLCGVHGLFHHLGSAQLRIEILDPALRGGPDRPGLFEHVHRPGPLGRRDAHSVLEVCRPDRCSERFSRAMMSASTALELARDVRQRVRDLPGINGCAGRYGAPRPGRSPA